MKLATFAHWAAIAGGSASVIGLIIYVATRPDPLIGSTVRVPLSVVRLSSDALGTTPIPSNLPGSVLVMVTDVTGGVVTGRVLSFESFEQILTLPPSAFKAQFSKNVIT